MITQEEWDKMKSHEHYNMYSDLDKRIRINKCEIEILDEKVKRLMNAVK